MILLAAHDGEVRMVTGEVAGVGGIVEGVVDEDVVAVGEQGGDAEVFGEGELGKEFGGRGDVAAGVDDGGGGRGVGFGWGEGEEEKEKRDEEGGAGCHGGDVSGRGRRWEGFWERF